VTQKLKRKAKEHLELPPAHVLRTETQSVPTDILSRLPEQEALKKKSGAWCAGPYTFRRTEVQYDEEYKSQNRVLDYLRTIG
jgi:hypothetical protein